MFCTALQLNPACECNQFSGCAVPGVIDLYQCFKIFVSVSAPHYYLSESSIRETIEGMNPKESLHETGCYIDLVRKFLKNINQSIRPTIPIFYLNILSKLVYQSLHISESKSIFF